MPLPLKILCAYWKKIVPKPTLKIIFNNFTNSLLRFGRSKLFKEVFQGILISQGPSYQILKSIPIELEINTYILIKSIFESMFYFLHLRFVHLLTSKKKSSFRDV